MEKDRYYDDAGRKQLRKSLLDGEAQKKANDFVKFFNGRVSERDSISSAQLRRFYHEFKGLEKKAEKLKTDEEFKRLLPLVKMVKSKAAYAKGTKKIPDSFSSWLTDHVNSIENRKDFDAFLLHFEAVVGFCYGLGLKNN